MTKDCDEAERLPFSGSDRTDQFIFHEGGGQLALK
jgi:hypothetical protein